VGSTEVLTIAIIVVFGVIMLPILFNENPSAFLENSICTIFVGPFNFTCTEPGGNVTFVGINPIIINATNGTITWSFNGTGQNGTGGKILIEGDQITINQNSTHAVFHLEDCTSNQLLIWYTLTEWTCIDLSTINGTAVNNTKTHISLGGDADVFKFENATHVADRGISGDNFINVTERENDVLIQLKTCVADGMIIVYDQPTDNYVCQTFQQIQKEFGLDRDEIMYPWQAGSSTGPHVILTFTNYDTRAMRMSGTAQHPTTATWMWPVPNNFNSSSTIEFSLWWITQNSDAGSICYLLQTMKRVPGQNIDTTFNPSVKICEANPGINILKKTTWTLTTSQHGLVGNDLAFIKLTRDQTDPTDDFNKDSYILVGKLIWNS